jgi:hypothetical protein
MYHAVVQYSIQLLDVILCSPLAALRALRVGGDSRELGITTHMNYILTGYHVGVS